MDQKDLKGSEKGGQQVLTAPHPSPMSDEPVDFDREYESVRSSVSPAPAYTLLWNMVKATVDFNRAKGPTVVLQPTRFPHAWGVQYPPPVIIEET